MPKDLDQFDTFEQALPEIIVGKTYRIKALLGKGGMGNVYLAEHLLIGKQYALKMLAPEQITQDNWNRLNSEGMAIARLDHPHIVKIHNMGVDETGYPYYVMDLLHGASLLDKLRQKNPPTFAELLTVFIQIASALDYSHKKGIIHRDIKPSNIMVLDNASFAIDTRLVDFGIAKLLQFSGADRQRLTATGEIFGTPYYMSPEQCIGAKLDPRSDAYSFGCTIFEALCGKPPFKGNSATETVMMHMQQAPQTLEEASGIKYGADIEDLVAKLLQKDRDHRYSSMQQVLHDLERIKANKPVAKQAKSLGFERNTVNINVNNNTKIVSSILLTIAITVTAVVVIFLSQPVAKSVLQATEKVPVKEIPLTSEELLKSSYIAALSKEDEQTIKDFLKSDQKITSKINKNGQRVIYCPAVKLGEVFAARNQCEDAIAWAQKTDTLANGETTIKETTALVLRINCHDTPAIWRYPELLTKFSKNVVEGITLEGYVVENAANAISDTTDQVIKALSSWSCLRYLELDDCNTSAKTIDRLDTHPELIVLKIDQPNFDASTLIKHKFLKNLINLKLTGARNIEPLLKALHGRNKITHLYFRGSELEPHAFDGLNNCKTLRFLELNQCKIYIEQIQAIKKIEKFHTLRICHCSGLTPQLREILESMRAKTNIDIVED